MQVILTGSIAIDRIMLFKGRFADVIQPDKLRVLSLSLLLDELQETDGGVAANIAYSLGLLGDQPVVLGSVGKNGQPYMQKLARLGAQIDHVHYSDRPTASFSVITDLDNCQVGGFYPGAMSDAASLTFQPWRDQSPLIVISPHDPDQMRHQVAECRSHNLRLFYDVGQQANNISPADIRAGIEAAELLIVNDYELGVITSKTGWSQAEILQKVSVCVVTLGENGCDVYLDGQLQHQPAAAVTSVVDPTGAGDAFRAGFIYGYVRGWKPLKCARLGAIVACFAIEQRGTQSHSFTHDEVETRYLEAFGEVINLDEKGSAHEQNHHQN